MVDRGYSPVSTSRAVGFIAFIAVRAAVELIIETTVTFTRVIGSLTALNTDFIHIVRDQIFL